MKKVLCLIMAIILTTVEMLAVKADEAVPEMYVTVSVSDAGDVVEAYIMTDDALNAYAGSFNVRYNSGMLEVTKCELGGVLENINAFTNPAYTENEIRVNFMTMEPVVKTGTVLKVTFRVIEIAGGCEISIEESLFYDLDGGSIDVDTVSFTLADEMPDEDIIEEEMQSGGEAEDVTPVAANENEQDDKMLNDTKQPAVKKFADMSGYAWAEKAVGYLANEGIIMGTSENEFSPQKNIKRGDFVLMLMRIEGIDEDAKAPFNDVSQEDYYYSAIATAYSKGYVGGTGNNEFKPQEFITRQDMFTIVYRIKAENDETEYADSNFEDMSSVSDYAVKAVNYLSQHNFIQGYDGLIRPLDNASRAETAVFLYNVFMQDTSGVR